MPTTSTGPLGLRLSSLIRAAGTTATILSGKSPGLLRTGLLAGGTHLAAREIDPAGLQVLSITPKGDINVHLGDVGEEGRRAHPVRAERHVHGVVGRRQPAARPARQGAPLVAAGSAVLLGAGVYLADDYMVNLVTRLASARPPAE